MDIYYKWCRVLIVTGVKDGEQWVKDAFSTVHPLIYCIDYLFLSGEE